MGKLYQSIDSGPERVTVEEVNRAFGKKYENPQVTAAQGESGVQGKRIGRNQAAGGKPGFL